MRPVLLALALWAAPAAAQEMIGTWELTAAENVPYEDDLVFARMTFTDREIRSTFVFLDPDDGELIGQIHTDRYVVSDGQLIVRKAGSTTVLDVSRAGDELTVRDLRTGVVLRLRAADPLVASDPDLLGAWAGVRRGAPLTLRFRPDGVAEIRTGEGDLDTEDYVVAGPYLLLGDDPAWYTFSRDAEGARHLVVEADGERTLFTRVSE